MDLIKIAKNGKRMALSLPEPAAPPRLPPAGNYDMPALRAFQKARSVYDRTLRAKLLAGYFVSAPPDTAAPGQVVYDGGFKNGVLVFDLHPTELLAVVAQVYATRVVIELVDLTSNARQTLDELTSKIVAFAHYVRFEASGDHVRFAVDGDTWRLHIATRTKERLATTDFADFRPITPLSNHMIVDASDRSRTRFVELGDEQLTVREGGRVLLQRELLHPTRTCWLAVLAPSGKRLALFFSGDGSKGDPTYEIEIWNVDSASRVSVLPMSGLFPDVPSSGAFVDGDTKLLLGVRYGTPRMVSLNVQGPATPRDHALPINRAPCQLLIRRDDTDVLFVDGVGMLLWAWPSVTTKFEANEDIARDRRAQYSDDGRWLATGSGHGRLVVRRAPV